MNRIKNKFFELHRKGEKALVTYITAGDPSLKVTEELCIGFASAGVDIIEIGVPFSDPTADGPVIQAAAQRALKNGATLGSVLNIIEQVRNKTDIPIVLFGYFNPIFSYGLEKFAVQAKKVGVDGVLIVDLPHEEAFELRQYTDPCGIEFISLIAPTTDDARIKKIVASAGGFLYYISITGITGTAKPDVVDIEREIARLKRFTSLPVVVGFGISTPGQAAEIAPHADGVVVGTAFVKMIAENSGRSDMVSLVSMYAQDIKKSLLMRS